MITVKNIPRLCSCSHLESHHSQYGDRPCYAIRHIKVRVRNQINNKYVKICSHWKCYCSKFEEYKEETK